MRLIVGLLGVVAVLGVLGSVVGIGLGSMQDFHPALDSFSHFHLHLVSALVLSTALLVIVRAGGVRVIALIVCLLSVGYLILESRKGPPSTGPRGDLRLVQFNLNYGNPVMAQVARELTRYDADIVTLQEVPPQHEAVLRGIAAYPHQAHCFFRNYIGGVSILSKHPVSAVDCAEGQGLVTALVDAPGGAVTVASIHTYWPWPFSQHEQIDRWVPVLEKLRGPVIVAGDFNAAPWSHAVTKVARASQTRVVPGIRMTIGVKVFPVIPAVPIPIDHVLVSAGFCASSARVGDALGSDHFPVIAELFRFDPTASYAHDPARQCPPR